MSRALYGITFIFIVLRGYLYFREQQTAAALLDLAFLPIYAFACIQERRNIYIALIAFLPASSIFYLPTRLIPFDLSMVIVLLAITLATRALPRRHLGKVFYYAVGAYAIVCAYLFANIFIDTLSGGRELQAQVKVLYYTLTAAAAAYLFGKVYETGDGDRIQAAIVVGIVSFIVAGCVGYLFPLSTYTWQLEAGVHFKSLFRYPGMSSSNYIAHVLLVMIAIHKFIGDRSVKTVHPMFYIGLIGVIAVVSQSRSFAITAVILIGIWVTLFALKDRAAIYRKVKQAGRKRLNIAIALAAAIVVVGNANFFLDLGAQTVGRFSVKDSSTINVSRRLDEWRQTFEHFERTDKSMLRGNLSYPEGLRPHNVMLGAALVFGVPIALLATFGFAMLIARFPILFFMFVGAQAEILFVTGIYDFLFLAFIAILCSQRPPPGVPLILRADGHGMSFARPLTRRQAVR